MVINEETTEGIVGLKKLQNNEYKIWSMEGIENADLSNELKEILYFIARENRSSRLPSYREIKNLIKGNIGPHKVLHPAKKKEMIFGVTIPEIVKHYGINYLDYRGGDFHPPEHLEWLKTYSRKFKGRRGSSFSWYKKIKNPRAPAYTRYWIALLEIDNEPCYIPLDLHIPKII